MRRRHGLNKRALRHFVLMVVAVAALCSEDGFASSSMESYVSEVDGSTQQYGLYLPDPWDPNVPHPLVIDLHWYGGRADTAFPWTSYADANGWIMVRPDGRGNTFYNGIGENDVFRVLEEVRGEYSIDEDRIYLHGCSMGGVGTLLLGLRHPHVFAAVSGRDGAGWDYHWHHRAQYGKASDPERIEPSREPLLQSMSAVHIAENGNNLNMQIMVHTGDTQVSPDENGRALHATLDQLGYEHSYHEYPGGHCAGGWESDTYNFLSQHANEPAPKDVLLKANQLKYGSAYWVRIDRLQKKPAADQFATIEVNARGGKQKDQVIVNASGLLQYTLSLTPELVGKDEASIYTNGDLSYTGPVGQITIFASLDEAGNIIGGSTEDTFPRGLCKTALIEGPIGHAYTSKFKLVKGTIGAKGENSQNSSEAQKFATEWNTWMHANIAPVEDTSITEDDIASTNLILFGTADSNSLIQEINDLLPVRIWTNRIVAGGNEYVGENYGLYMIFPNPLNPEKYVVISHGAIEGSYARDLEPLPWYWPDYVVFDTDVVPSQAVPPPSFMTQLYYLPDAWVEAGFFDQYWRLDNDEDGLDDIFEKDIVDADPGDDIAAIADVNPEGDFDGDEQDNRTEYGAGTDPTSSDSFFSVLSARPDPSDRSNFLVSWKVARGRSYCILWADSVEGPWHEVAQLNPADVSDEGDIRAWADKGTDPAMEGKRPGDCPQRFYKVMGYR